MMKIAILFAFLFAFCHSNPLDLEIVRLNESVNRHLNHSLNSSVLNAKRDEMKRSMGQIDLGRVNSGELSPEERELFSEGSSSVDPEIAKLCQSSSNFKYYQPYPNNASRYIQCDPWGNPIVKSCEAGQVWSSWALRCESQSEVQSSTNDLSWVNQFQSGSQLVDCNQQVNICQNQGVCTKVADGFRCVCSGNFTGEFCEIQVESWNVYSEIISGRFSLDRYRQILIAENQTEDSKYFEKFRDVLDSSTYEGLVKYISLYKQGDVRFDRIINSLVEDILQNIYPDAYYLSIFNASSESVSNVVRMVPNLLSYARYSNERYAQVFMQYNKVLNELAVLLNSSWPSVHQEASEYSRLASLYLNRSLTAMNISRFGDEKSFNVNPIEIQWTENEVRERMREEYNQTLETTNELARLLTNFKKNAVVEMLVKPEVREKSLGSAKFDGAPDAVRLFEEISRSSDLIWESLVNYGFWFLTNQFAQNVAPNSQNGVVRN